MAACLARVLRVTGICQAIRWGKTAMVQIADLMLLRTNQLDVAMYFDVQSRIAPFFHG